MNITILQTADHIFYRSVLDSSSRTVAAYCVSQGIRYESFVGIKRGTMPWHSAYNRVYLLKEMLDRGVQGWVLYLDADALIVDQHFDIRKYFEQKTGKAAVFAGYSEAGRKETINSGGFAVNLSHPIGVSLVRDYYQAVLDIPDTIFNSSLKWGREIQDDQGMLQGVIEKYLHLENVENFLDFEEANNSFVNNGAFIRQHLRSGWHNFGSRQKGIADEAELIMLSASKNWDLIDPGFYVEAEHPKMHSLVGKKIPSAIRSQGQTGILTYGPYVDLGPGQWVMRVIGHIKALPKNSESSFSIDLCSDLGREVHVRKEVHITSELKGVIGELSLSLSSEIKGAELRMFVNKNQDIDVYAVHFANRADWIDRDA